MPEYPFYPKYHDVIDILETFPDDITTVRNLSEGWGNGAEPLKALFISDNPNDIEDEPVVLLTGVIHGREPLGLRAVLGLADNLASNYHTDPAIRAIVDNYQIVIVPVMNRWGYNNQARKNNPSTDVGMTTGVDLNRNGAFGWERCDDYSSADKDGVNGPDCHEPLKGTFRGRAPNSEYETRTMQSVVEWLKPVFGVVFHSGGGLTRGGIYSPYGLQGRGDDGINGTADDHFLAPLKGESIGPELAAIMADSVLSSRRSGLFCADPNEVPGACNEPFHVNKKAGSAGSTVANYYALTGMIELLVETHAFKFTRDGEEFYNAWTNTYMYELEPAGGLRADRQARLDYGREYARSYADGLHGLLQGFMCSGTSDEASFKGPGFTGRVLDQHGQPVAATVKVREVDTGWRGNDPLHGDFIDANQDPSNRNWAPFGETDFKYRKAQADTGRFYRLLPRPGDFGSRTHYTIEVSADSMVTRTFVRTPSTDGCLEDLGDIILSDVSFHPLADNGSGICTVAPQLTGIRNGNVLAAGSTPLSWTSNGCHYWVYAGDGPNRNNYHNQSMAGATSVTIGNYPADGADVYLTLLYRNTNIIGAPWSREYFVFTAPSP